MSFVDFAENIDGALHFAGGGVVGDADVHHGFNIGPAGDVRDNGIAHGFVRHGDEVSIQVANAGAAQTDAFHGAIDATDLDAVADLKGFIDKDRDRAKKVPHRVLRGEAQGQPADGDAGQEGADIEIKILQCHQDRDDDNDRFHCLANDGEEEVIEVFICPDGGRGFEIGDKQVHNFHQHVRQGNGEDDVKGFLNVAADPGGEIEHLQTDLEKNDKDQDFERPV